MDKSVIIQLAEKYRNWGRWGPEDELGTLNFVTPEKVTRACSLVKKGRVFSLAIPFDATGPQHPSPTNRRFNPIHVMLRTGGDAFAQGEPPIMASSDDMVSMPLQCATQWDSLAHVFYRGTMYNNRPATLVTGTGAEKNSIDRTKDRMAGRGVLLDVARHKGARWLEPGYAITAQDLDDCARRQRVQVEQGDFLLVRTGHQTLCRSRGDWGEYAGGDAPGLSLMTVPWLHEKEVASVASDTWGVEVRPNEVPDVRQPWHAVVIPNLGLAVGEIFHLDELAEACAADGVYEFLFVAPPIPITRAVGSPVNPMAIK
ncbi:MAG: cyclase family protein [Chloroflexi bacterium]|nr:cyclase family protein [Chloroflexota bacterium]